MKTNTVPKEVRSFSVNDLRLKRYVELQALIKASTKELEALKEEIIHRGTHTTSHYVVTVVDQSRTNPPSLAKLVEVYGEEVRELCTVSTFKKVTVGEK